MREEGGVGGRDLVGGSCSSGGREGELVKRKKPKDLHAGRELEEGSWGWREETGRRGRRMVAGEGWSWRRGQGRTCKERGRDL